MGCMNHKELNDLYSKNYEPKGAKTEEYNWYSFKSTTNCSNEYIPNRKDFVTAPQLLSADHNSLFQQRQGIKKV